MKKALCILLICMTFCSFALAEEIVYITNKKNEQYYINLEITLPSDYKTLVYNLPENDANLQAYGITQQQANDLLDKHNDVHLYAENHEDDTKLLVYDKWSLRADDSDDFRGKTKEELEYVMRYLQDPWKYNESEKNIDCKLVEYGRIPYIRVLNLYGERFEKERIWYITAYRGLLFCFQLEPNDGKITVAHEKEMEEIMRQVRFPTAPVEIGKDGIIDEIIAQYSPENKIIVLGVFVVLILVFIILKIRKHCRRKKQAKQDVNSRQCRACGELIGEETKICPSCGTRQ